MKILVACEESQAVTIELRKLGHEAYSCDIEPCSGGHPEWHLQQDVTPLLEQKWDMILAFPPCTHLAASGAKHFSQKRADGRQQQGIDFFKLFTATKCKNVAIENPVGIMSTEYRKPDQIIQPWQFGDPFEKRTCLWIKGLPKLIPKNIVNPPERQVVKSGKTMPSWYSKGGKDRQKNRSKTFPGIAKAMADQWAGDINQKVCESEGQMMIKELEDGRRLTHLSLFSGIGGLDLAAEWAGFESVGQCEFADYPTRVLERHWPDVPRWRDIRTLTGESFYERTGLRTVDIISGGFPCQPFSVAGKQRGKEDDRYLWPEMVRVIKELRPTWVIGENVAGIINMALDDVLSDLEGEGYATRTFLIPAHAVGAPHRRYRTAIVGYSEHNGLYATTVCGGIGEASRWEQERKKEAGKPSGTSESRHLSFMADTNSNSERRLSSRKKPTYPLPVSGGEDVCNATGQRLPDRPGGTMGKPGEEQEPKRSNCHRGEPDGTRQWAVEPDVGRVANGIPNRVDRIKCLGNAVVPQQFYPIFKAIADIELESYIRVLKGLA